MKHFFLSFAMVIIPLAAQAQQYVSDKHIGIENGLSNNFILDIAFDGRGFAWVATESGLNRVAGNICTTYNKRNETDGMLITALNYNIQTDKMIIGLEQGFCIYDCAHGTFKQFIPASGPNYSGVANIANASDKNVWLYYSNGKVVMLDCETYEQTPLTLSTTYGGRCCMDDGNGHLYLGHKTEGMSIVSLHTNSTKHFKHQDNDPTSLPGNNVRCIYMDSKKNIWVGTDHGLARFNPSTHTFTKLTHPSASYDDNVFAVRELKDGRLWVASDMGGIDIIDTERLAFVEDAEVTLSSMNARAIAQDEFGNIWVGNHSTGIDIVFSNKNLFQIVHYTDRHLINKRVYGITSDQKGRVWMGGEDEIALYDKGRIVKTWLIGARKNRTHLFVMCMMADRYDNIWLGIEDEGVIKFDSRTEQFERIDLGYAAPDIRSFYEDRDGTVWIGSEFSLFSYKKGIIRKEKYIGKRVASGMARTANGVFLVGTIGGGLFVFDKKGESPRRLYLDNGLPSNRINHLLLDRERGLWLASHRGLIYVKDIRHLEQFEVFDQKQGLSDNHICAILQDWMGHIWVSTYTGISCFDPQKKRFYNYNHMSGLPSGSFVAGSATVTADGTMFFGSPNGVCRFNPQTLNTDGRVSDVQIVTCEAYNPTGENTEILQLMPNVKGQVNTNYQQNTIRIAFTAKNCAELGNVEYSYMMKGMNDKWYYIGNDNDVVFRGLNPGNYTFIIRAKLKNQDWTEASSTEFSIHIAPPFWRSWWAYLVYVFLATAIGWGLLKNYKRRLFLRNSLEMERRENLQKQELNEERLRFFTNITHELRTPLTLILGPLEDLINDRRMPELYHRKVGLINKSAERLRNLVNEILEFRKTETQNRRLTVAKGDLGALVTEIGESYKQLNRNPKTAISVTIQPGVPPVYFDSEVITTVLNNFLSNAVKYTPEGRISVTLADDGKGHVNLAVQDTGYGIRKEALPHIFDRYYQADSKHQAEGTGIGLALVKSLADLHEATLTVESEEGKGSTFTFSLLTDNSYPGALHKEDKTQENTGRGDGRPEEGLTETESNELPLLLVVEDNDDIRQYIAESMGEDFRVIQAADGREGTALAVEQMPDIIVSDIMMPRMNGIELTRRVKEDIRTCHIPVILLTAKDSVEDKEEGYDCGADSYLTKPFSARLLQSRIQNLLSSRRRLAELTAFRQAGTQEVPPTEGNVPALNRLDREFLDKMNQVIENHITTEDLNMDFMSDKMAMSYSTFYRKVKALTGMTAKEYILKRRLYHCAKLLQSGDYNVTEAATMTGFNDQNNFRLVFKKEFGITPSAYKCQKNA